MDYDHTTQQALSFLHSQKDWQKRIGRISQAKNTAGIISVTAPDPYNTTPTAPHTGMHITNS